MKITTKWLSIIALVATIPHGFTNAQSVGGCVVNGTGPTANAFSNGDEVEQGDAVVCSTAYGDPRTSGIQAPAGDVNVNNVSVEIQTGVVIDINGSTIGLGSNSTVSNAGTLNTQQFFNGHGISSGANRRSELGGNEIVNESSGIIRTGGTNGVGVLINARKSTALGNTIVNRGLIETAGNRADGIRLLTTTTNAVENSITNSGQISTRGEQANGISVANNQGVIEILITGSIEVTGVNAHGILSQGALDLTVSGSVSALDGAAIDMGSATNNVTANRVTLQAGTNIRGPIVFDASKTSETLVLESFAGNVDTPGYLNNTITGLNRLAATGGTDVVLGAQSYSLGSSEITVDGTSTLQFDGVIDAGTIIAKLGEGSLVLNAANQMTGMVSVTEGTLQVNVDTAAGSGQIAIADGASLRLGVDGLNISNDISLSGKGAIVIENFSATLSGDISGLGSLTKTGDGTLTLTGENTYSGGSSVLAGTLALGSGLSAGSESIVLSDDTTLEATNDFVLLNPIEILGSSSISTLSNNLSLNGSITGDELKKIGTGVLTLGNKDNRYSGGTIVYAGTVDLKQSRAAGTGPITIMDATLRLGEEALNIANDTILASSDSRVEVNGIDAIISGLVSGEGRLVKTGSGTLTLPGANTYLGGTSVSSGRLALGDSSSAGEGSIALSDDTALQLNSDMSLSNAVAISGISTIATGTNSVSINGVVSGMGLLVKTGAGALTLKGSNTYTGGSELLAGTLVAASDTALGTATVEVKGADVVLMAGKSNLRLGNALMLTADLVMDTAGEFVVLHGDITGASRLIKQGQGTLTLAGKNVHAGGTEVQVGTLALDLSSAAGAGEIVMAADTSVQANSNLVLDNVFKLGGTVGFNTQSFDVTLNNSVLNNSTGELVKTGTGALILTGTNFYSAGTQVREGSLVVHGSLASGVQLQSGTELGGTGIITGDVINRGLIQPRQGALRGDITIVGNYIGEGGAFVSTLEGTAQNIVADKLVIQGVGHVASGVTTITVVDPNELLGKPTVGDGILLVDVSEGAMTTPNAFQAPPIISGAYEYKLVQGGEDSQQSWYLRADQDEPQPPVVVTPEASQREEVALYPALPSLARQYLWSINGTLDDRRGAPDVIGQWDTQPLAWARLIAQRNETKPGNVSQGPGMKVNDWGLQLGADLWRSDSDWGQWRAGPVLTIGRSTGGAYNTTGSVQTGDVSLNAYSLGLNATVASDQGAYADLLLLGTRLTGVQASSPLGTSINTTGWAFSGSIEGGWRLPLTDKFAVTPQAQIYTTTVNLQDSADAYSLVQMPTETTVLGRVGLKLSYDNIEATGPRTQLWARASVYSTLSGEDASTSFLNVAGTNPTTFQSQAPDTWMALEAAVNVQATDSTSVQFGFGYQTTFDNQYRGIYGQVNVRVGF